jgi:hypothetical protein
MPRMNTSSNMASGYTACSDELNGQTRRRLLCRDADRLERECLALALFGRGDLTDDVGFWGVKRTHKCPDKTEFRPQTLDFPAGGSTYLAFPAAAASCPGPD